MCVHLVQLVHPFAFPIAHKVLWKTRNVERAGKDGGKRWTRKVGQGGQGRWARWARKVGRVDKLGGQGGQGRWARWARKVGKETRTV
eukprot:15435152-Alexandrium_andersonii.AAC.1